MIPISLRLTPSPLSNMRWRLQSDNAQLRRYARYIELRCCGMDNKRKVNGQDLRRYGSAASSYVSRDQQIKAVESEERVDADEPKGNLGQVGTPKETNKETIGRTHSVNSKDDTISELLGTGTTLPDRKDTFAQPSGQTRNKLSSRPDTSPKQYYSRSNKLKKKPTIPSSVSPELPISPLLSEPERFQKYSKTHPKAYTPQENRRLPKLQEALKYNPYARMLITPIRNDVEFQRRLPGFFLDRFITLIHPLTKEPWILPDQISPITLSRKTRLRAKYILSRYDLLKTITTAKKKIWQKLGPDEEALDGKIDAVTKVGKELKWRNDMHDHVLNIIRQRVEYQVSLIVGTFTRPVEIHHSNSKVDVMGLREGDEVGCILTWSTKVNGKVGERQETGFEDKLTSLEDGRAVPVHNINDLWEGDEDGPIRVKRLLKLDKETEHAVLLQDPQTCAAQMWLMKLRWFVKPVMAANQKDRRV